MKTLQTVLITLVAVLFVTVTGASAATLTTAPFPGYFISAGFAHCAITNVGTIAGTVTLYLMDVSGAILRSNGPASVDPGATFATPAADLSVSAAVWCKFTVPNTVRYRGSFIYTNGNLPPTVIRAQ